MSATNQMGTASLARNAVLFASELVVPGGSNLTSGNIATGIKYAAVGLFAKSVIGFPAMVLVSASSYSKATTGLHLTDLVGFTKVGADDTEARIAEARIAEARIAEARIAEARIAEARIAEMSAKIQALEARLEALIGATQPS